ncbi:MAG: hypothetical protein Kow0059_07320 [Candidatus Sumerlaeia bacterium]
MPANPDDTIRNASAFTDMPAPARRPIVLIFSAMMIVGMAVRAFYLIHLPLERLIELWVTDDGFYYFVTADNWASGFPSTFDREHFTNGYHPVWMMICVGVFRLAGGATPAAIKVVLALAHVCQALTAILIVALGRKIWSKDLPAFLAGGLFIISPSVFTLGFNGLETALALMLLLAFYLVSLSSWDQGKFKVVNAVVPGVLAGLSFLTRTDQVFYLISAWGAAFIAGRAPARRWVLASGVVALMLAAPWLMWNFIRTGHIVQASAWAYPTLLLHNAGQYLRPNTFWNRLPWLLPILGRVIKTHLPALFVESNVFWGVLGGTLLLVWLRGRLRSGERRDADGRDEVSWRFGLILIPLAGVACLLIVHALVRAYPRHWYFSGFSVVAALGAGELIRRLNELIERPALTALVVTMLAALGFWPMARSARGGYYLNQGVHREAALWANAHLPARSRIGAFNAGTLSYYCTLPVINLDGTTNNDALPPLRNKTMWSYILSERLDYLIDARYTVETDYKVVMDIEGYPDSCLERLHRVEYKDPNFEFYVYRIRQGR